MIAIIGLIGLNIYAAFCIIKTNKIISNLEEKLCHGVTAEADREKRIQFYRTKNSIMLTIFSVNFAFILLTVFIGRDIILWHI